jgi:FeS assembly SUF system protein
MFSLFRKRDEDQARDSTPNAAAVEPPAPVEEAAAPAPTDTHGLDVGALVELPSEPAGGGSAVGPSDPVKTSELKPQIVEALSTVFDPEIPVNIYELGLIYDIVVDAEARVAVSMTLTSPACPSAQQLPSEVEWKVKAVPGVTTAKVEVVWEPPWSPDRMSEAARLSLGMF